MINLLRRLFIKDYQNVSLQPVREKHGKLASLVGILSNLVLFIIKLFAGIFSGSISIIADSINNLSDMGSSVITLVGFKLASKPADDDHPYGHERIEYISGLMVSIIILVVGAQLLYNSVLKIIEGGSSDIKIITLIFLVVSIVIKIWQSYFNKTIGKLIGSVALEATAADSRNDVIATTAILIGAIITFFFDYNLDGYLGVLVSLFILYSGLKSIKDTTNPLIGITPDHQFVKNIISDIKNFDEDVIGTHDPVCHMYGPTKCFMSIHVEVPAEHNFMQMHDMVDNIENYIKKKYAVDLVIHMDPVKTTCAKTNRLKEAMKEFLKEIDPILSLHDFRIVDGPTHTNVIFDLVVPRKYKISEDELKRILEIKLKEIDDCFNLVINVENDYILEV